MPRCTLVIQCVAKNTLLCHDAVQDYSLMKTSKKQNLGEYCMIKTYANIQWNNVQCRSLVFVWLFFR